MTDLRRTPEDRLVIDRLQQLRVVLPAMATEAAAARREAARLRVENARLARRVAELESVRTRSHVDPEQASMTDPRP